MTDPTYVPAKSDDGVNPWRTVTRWLIVINVAFFVVDAALAIAGYGRAMFRHDGQPIVQQLSDGRFGLIGQPILTSFGYFSVDLAIVGKQVWRLFTYQFVHANVEHILLNMIGLLLAGPLVEARMGRGRYLLFYLVCGAAGPVAHVALSMIGLTQMGLYTPLVGASASIYGVLVAAARIAPNEMVMLSIPPIDMRLKNFVLLMIGLSLAAVLWRWQNAGGHAAHLGGAVAGYFLSRRFAAKRAEAD